VDNTTGIDYGPLSALLGIWEGDKGVDVAPESDGTEENLYYERLCFEAAGDVTNAEQQVLAVVRYHQLVSRKSNHKVFHDQVGYWTWDKTTAEITQSLTIPRVVTLLAGGIYLAENIVDEDKVGKNNVTNNSQNSVVKLTVAAAVDHADWRIIESPFMRDNASTRSYRHELKVGGGILSYKQTTMLDIYGSSFEHTDTNELVKQL